MLRGRLVSWRLTKVRSNAAQRIVGRECGRSQEGTKANSAGGTSPRQVPPVSQHPSSYVRTEPGGDTPGSCS